MKKIKRFTFREKALVLSQKDMRLIGGGNSASKCNTGKCVATLTYNDGSIKDIDGSCASYKGNCYCIGNDGGYYSNDNIKYNGCMIGGPII